MARHNVEKMKSASAGLSHWSLSHSGTEPLATSSPSESLNEDDMSPERCQAEFEKRFQTYIDAMKKEFEDGLIAGIPAHIRSLPFSQFLEILSSKDKPKKAQDLDTSESVFKLPTAPQQKKNESSKRNKSVRWEDFSNDENTSAAGCHGSVLKTPKRTTKEPFAVVTPGPNMSQVRTVLRLAKEGETAVSLAGSPLMFTPFSNNRANRGTLIVEADDGNTLAILKPPSESSMCEGDPQLSELQEETKKKIKEFATYLLKSLD